MKTDDKKRFLAAFGAMCELFEKQASKEFTRLYFKCLEDLSIQEAELAIATACKTLKFFPKPVELLEIVKRPESDNEKAEKEAMKVIEQIRFTGSYGTPVFDDPVTVDVMTKRFRWYDVCMTPEKELKWFIRDFVDAYKNYQPKDDQKQIENPPAQLIELADKIGRAVK
jgi:hypothetical protein